MPYGTNIGSQVFFDRMKMKGDISFLKDITFLLDQNNIIYCWSNRALFIQLHFPDILGIVLRSFFPGYWNSGFMFPLPKL